MSSNQVTFTLQVIPENLDLISKLITGNATEVKPQIKNTTETTTEATPLTTAEVKAKTKPGPKPKAKTVVEDDEDEAPKKRKKPGPKPKAKKVEEPEDDIEDDEDEDQMTFEQFKAAAKKSKTEHGLDFTMSVLTDSGIKAKSTLGQTVSAVPEKSWSFICKFWELGPDFDEDEAEDAEIIDDEDDLDDEEEQAEVTAEAVKQALRAYSKEHGRDAAKDLMTKYKVAALSKVDDMPESKMVKMFAELV